MKEILSWKIRSKTMVPRIQVELIQRDRLLGLIDDQSAKPLMLITAPAGFGKTTLVSEWLKSKTNDTVRAWISMDRDDADPHHFLTYLLIALETAGVEMRELQAVSKGTIPDVPAKYIVAAIGDLLAENDSSVLVLDDYHLAESPELNELMSQLIQALPEHCQLVVCSRYKPGFSISSLRLHGLVAEIKDAELSFDKDEMQRFCDGSVTEPQLEQLMRHTEGWPAALQLAKLCKLDGDDIARLGDLPGGHAQISEYLTEQVLSDLESEEYRLLLETAFLDEVHVSLADHVRGRNDSRYILQKLFRLRPLVSRIADDMTSYRYQHFFRGFMAQQMRKELSEDDIQNLRRRAASWYLDQGELLSAMRQLCVIGDYEAAAQYLTEDGGWAPQVAKGMSVVRSILKMFPREFIERYPELRFCRIFERIKQGRLSDARNDLNNVKKQDSTDWNSRQTKSLLILETTLDTYQDREFSKQSMQTLAMIAKDNAGELPGVLALERTMEILHHVRTGDMAVAYSRAEQAVAEINEADALYAKTFFYFYLGLTAWHQLNWKEAERRYLEGVEFAIQNFGKLSGVAAAGQVMLAHYYYYVDRNNDACSGLYPSLDILSAGDAWHEPLTCGYDTDFRLCLAHQGSDAALQVLEHGIEIARQRELQRFEILLFLLRAESMLADGDHLSALEYVTKTVAPLLPSGWEKSLYWWQVHHHYRRVRLQCLWRMDQPTILSRELNRKGPRHDVALYNAENDLWLACYEFQKGNSDNAVGLVAPIVKFVSENGGINWVLSTGAPLESVLEYLGQKHPLDRDVLGPLLESVCQNSPEDTKPSLLSDREYQVLVMLQDGISNKEIARHLDTSENTIKFHLKNIYRKLGVNKRMAAVEAARQMKLIS